MNDVFEGVFGQPQVRNFLRSTIDSGRYSHAYLFSGPAGSSKTSAAYSFAQAILCPKKGCKQCEICRKIQRRRHPDVHHLFPEGAKGYLVSQIRDLIADVNLAPIQADKKVYILDRVDQMDSQAANAFLKTLEEPPDDVIFILLSRMRESVLPTIVSRCQVVPFRTIPAREAVGIVSQNSGVDAEQARIAIEACGGSTTKAIGFAKSAERNDFRKRVIEVLKSLPIADERDVLEYGAELIELSKAWLDVIIDQQTQELDSSADFLSKSALKQVEARHKRVLTQASRESLQQLTAIIRSWLRDQLMLKAGLDDQVVNVDYYDDLYVQVQRVSEQGLVRAIDETYRCDYLIAYNVSSETCIDTLLFTIREVLNGSSSSH